MSNLALTGVMCADLRMLCHVWKAPSRTSSLRSLMRTLDRWSKETKALEYEDVEGQTRRIKEKLRSLH